MSVYLDHVYLDHNATSPMRPEVRGAMEAAFAHQGNASSSHRAGRAARELIDAARDAVAAAIGADRHQLVFTSGGTEANLLGLYGLARELRAERLLISKLEHPAVRMAAEWLAETYRMKLIEFPCLPSGRVDPAAAIACLDAATPTVAALTAAQNETGALQPVAELAARLRDHPNPSLRLHCDASQGLGRTALDMATLGVDSLALSAHKAGGPKGVGATVFAALRDPPTLMAGGGQENRRRGGTENVPAIAGFGALADLLRKDGLRREIADVTRLRDRMESVLLADDPDLMIGAGSTSRLPNTSCLIPTHGPAAAARAIALDLAGFAVSAGSACASGKRTPSEALIAMGIEPERERRALRVSLGHGNDDADIDAFIAAWRMIHRRAAA